MARDMREARGSSSSNFDSRKERLERARRHVVASMRLPLRNRRRESRRMSSIQNRPKTRSLIDFSGGIRAMANRRSADSNARTPEPRANPRGHRGGDGFLQNRTDVSRSPHEDDPVAVRDQPTPHEQNPRGHRDGDGRLPDRRVTFTARRRSGRRAGPQPTHEQNMWASRRRRGGTSIITFTASTASWQRRATPSARSTPRDLDRTVAPDPAARPSRSFA